MFKPIGDILYVSMYLLVLVTLLYATKDHPCNRMSTIWRNIAHHIYKWYECGIFALFYRLNLPCHNTGSDDGYYFFSGVIVLMDCLTLVH